MSRKKLWVCDIEVATVPAIQSCKYHVCSISPKAALRLVQTEMARRKPGIISYQIGLVEKQQVEVEQVAETGWYWYARVLGTSIRKAFEAKTEQKCETLFRKWVEAEYPDASPKDIVVGAVVDYIR